MTRVVSAWRDVPRTPAVYAMYGGEPPRTWVAYVGMAGDIQGRLIQHFVRRDSSVVTGSSAVGVNIDLSEIRRLVGTRRLRKRRSPPRGRDDRLRGPRSCAAQSRQSPTNRETACRGDGAFRAAMKGLFKNPATGRFTPPLLWGTAVRVGRLEGRVDEMEARLRHLEGDA
jgi:hypothetical protein